MSSVGERIRQLRGKVSREIFSNKYRIHRNTLERWEKGLRTPSEEFLAALAEGERVNFDWVKFGRGQMEMHPDLREENVSPRLQRASSAEEPKTCDMSQVLGSETTQHLENTVLEKNQTCDMSQVVELQRDLLEAVRQNGDLRVEVERLHMDIERRDARIAELERRLAEALTPQGGQALLDKGRAAAG